MPSFQLKTTLLLAYTIALGCTDKAPTGESVATTSLISASQTGTQVATRIEPNTRTLISGIIAIDLDDNGPAGITPVAGALVGVEGRPETNVETNLIGAFTLALDIPDDDVSDESNKSSLALITDDSRSPQDKTSTRPENTPAQGASSLPFTVVATYVKDGKTFAKRLTNLVIIGGRTLDLGTLSLAETGAIAGKATLSDGSSALGTDVYVPGTSYVAKTDQNGAFIIMYVPEGQYDLVYQRDGFAYVTQSDIFVLPKKVTEVRTVELIAQDNTPPNITIETGPPQVSNLNTGVFELASTEAGSTYLCRLDNDRFSPCSAVVAYRNLPEGEHSFEALSIDASGNKATSPATWRWKIDLTAPIVSIVHKPQPIIGETNVNFEFSANDNSLTWSCLLDGNPYQPCDKQVNLSNLSAGLHSLQVKATDVAGNSGAPIITNWEVDLTEVDTLLISGPPNLISSPQATIVFSANKRAGFRCVFDNGPSMSCSSPLIRTNLANGTHTAVIVAVDETGREDQYPLTVSWTIDSELPVASIESGPDSTTNNNVATFNLSSNEALSTFRCRIDNSPFAPCQNIVSFARLAEGFHVFEAHAIDGAGNSSLSPAVWRWSIDLTPPSLVVTSKPEAVTASNSAAFTVSANESNVEISCLLDGFPHSPCGSTVSISNLPSGFHTIQMTPIDQSGNIGRPVIVTWEVDLTAVDTTLISGPASLTTSTDATVIFSSNKKATFSCVFDSGPASPCTSPLSWTNLTNGTHSLVVTARDLAGTDDLYPLHVNWTVDAIPPLVPTPTPVTLNLTNSATPNLAWGASSDDTKSYDLEVDLVTSFNSTSVRRFSNIQTRSQAVTPQISDGTWYFRVRAIDHAGNASDWSNMQSFVVDTQPPAIPVTDYLPELTNENQPQFSWQTAVDATRYRLMIAKDSIFNQILFDQVNLATLSWTPNSPISDGILFWKVAAIDQAGNQSAFSLPKFFTIDTSLPATPTLLTAPALTNNPRPTWTWSSVSEAVTYRVQMSISSTFSSLSVNDATITATSYTPPADLADNIYYVRVAAVNASGTQGGFSVPKSITIDTTAPAAPILNAFSPSTTNDLTPAFTWSDGGGGAVSYDILIKQGSTTLDTQTGLLTRSYIPSTALPVGLISWQVRARDGAGNIGAYSTASNVTLTSAATWTYKFPAKRTVLSGMDTCFMGFDVDSLGNTVALGANCSTNALNSRNFKNNYWNSIQTLSNISSILAYGPYIARDFQGNILVASAAGMQIKLQTYNFNTSSWSSSALSPKVTGCPISSCYTMINSVLDDGADVHIIYSLTRDGITDIGLFAYLFYSRQNQSWSSPIILGPTAEYGMRNIRGGQNYGFYYQGFARKHHDAASMLFRRNGIVNVFYYASGLSAFLWKSLDVSSQSFDTLASYSSTSSSTFADTERIFVDSNGWPVLERYKNGSDFKWTGSNFAITSNPNPKLVMSVATNAQPTIEKDTTLVHTLGTTTTNHAIEDDDGTILTSSVGGVSLTRYGHPFTAILNQTQTSVVEVAPSWKVWSIDKQKSVGLYTSLTFDSSGNPSIAYRSGVSNNLKLVSFDGTSWTTETVDTSLGSGYYAAIGRKATGKVVIAHYQSNTGDLKLSSQGTSGTWSHFTVDQTGDVGRFASLAMDGDNYAIAYHDETQGSLKLATFDGSNWVIETVDQGVDVGEHTSLKIQGSTKHIAYYDAANHTLKYANFSQESWQTRVVDDQGDVGKYASLALTADGRPMISYYNATNNDLMFAEYDGTSWTKRTLQSVGDVGLYTSIAVDTLNQPHICYYDSTNSALGYSNRDGGIWASRLVDGESATEDKGPFCSMGINPINGSPSASYYDVADGGVSFVDGMVQY